MLVFLNCVAEAAVEKGLKGLLALVPGGQYAYDVGEAALRKYRDRKKEADLYAEVQDLARATFEQVHADAVGVVRDALAARPAAATPEEAVALELWLSGIPDATRQSLKRKDDPTGESLPFGYTIHTADDVVKLLPPRPPKFTPGAALPGRAGWKLDRLLGVGGFGEVWFARNARLPNLAGAVKFCHGQQARDLQHEGGVIDRLMAAGRHPHIVPLTDADLDGDTPWLMYEYVPGGTLADWVHRWQGKEPAERYRAVLAALGELVGAVGFFHRLGPPIVHRDLKPSNVLLGADGRLRVTDFGIGSVAAKAVLTLDARGHSTRGGRLLTYMRGSHTPLYASPQQKAGADPDPRDDIHALGVIAYQMFTGNLTTAPGRDMDDDLRDAGAADGLIDLLARCVAQKADRRPKDAAELAERLAALSAGRAEGASPPVPAPAPVPVPASVPAVAPEGLRPPLAKTPAARAPGEVVHVPLPGGLTMPFCWVPPGTAQLGSPLAEQNAVAAQLGKREDWLAAESEARRGEYTTKGFWLAKYPVTQEEWHALTSASPSHFQAGSGGADKVKGLDTTRFPVENVSWDDICGKGGFLELLNARGGVEKVFGQPGKFVLPHENQWEYACRGNLGNKRAFYWGGELNGTQANCAGIAPFGTDAKGPYLERTTAVGSYEKKAPHPWGLCDLHGNVWEWCENKYDNSNEYRVLRGGAWLNYGHYCRAACRGRNAPDTRSANVGVRLLVPGLMPPASH